MKPQFGEQPSPSHPHSQGIVADYLLNAGTGTKVFDYSRNNSAGILSNTTWAPGGLGFNGNNGLLALESNALLNNLWSGKGATIIANIKVPASDGDSSAPRFCEKRDPGNTKGWSSLIRREFNGKKKLTLIIDWAGGVAGWETTVEEVPINKMVQVGMRYSSASTANVPLLSVEGLSVPITELAAPTGGGPIDDSTEPFLVGNRAALDRGMLGVYGGFLIYDRILSDAEMLQHNFNPFARFERPTPARYFFIPTPLLPDSKDFFKTDIHAITTDKEMECLGPVRRMGSIGMERQLKSIN